MSTIKKNFETINTILVANQDKKVSEIMHLLLVEMESKQQEKTYMTNEHGLWVFCYYHKEWELVGEQVEYGKKANTKTGYNTMCKVGVNCWTKQQRDFKAATAGLVDRIASGDLQVEDLEQEREALALEKDKIIPLSEFYLDEAIAINVAMIHEEALKLNEEHVKQDEAA